MESSTTGTSTKRSGPFSPGKRVSKKRRGEQVKGQVALKYNWMAPLTASIAGVSPQDSDPYAFIQIEASCMCYYLYNM